MSPSYSATGESSSWTMYAPVSERLTSGSAAGGVAGWLAFAAFTSTGTPAMAAISAVATRIAWRWRVTEFLQGWDGAMGSGALAGGPAAGGDQRHGARVCRYAGTDVTLG